MRFTYAECLAYLGYAAHGRSHSTLAIFIFLQIPDLATTLVVLAQGGREPNPNIQHFMTVGPVAALVISKLTVTAIAVAVVALGKAADCAWPM